MTPDHEFRDYRGRRVTVMGLGSFGGGLGAVKFLTERGAEVTVTDLRTESQLAEAIRELQASPPRHWHLGGHQGDDFTQADLIVVNPAIRRDHPLLALAAERGVPLTSEMNLFWQHQRGRIVAVTGSNGKSTTTALIHAMLRAGFASPLAGEGGRRPDEGVVTGVAGRTGIFSNSSPVMARPLTLTLSPEAGARGPEIKPQPEMCRDQRPPGERGERTVWLGGNIGRSLLPEVDSIQPADVVVLELSSFQLTDLDRLQVSPTISVVTNFSPNHLDWHDTAAHYRQAKQTMLRWQSESDIAVLNADDPDVERWPVRGRRLRFGLSDHGGEGTFLRGEQGVWRLDGIEREFPIRSWLRLPGRHNLANALAAAAAALAAGATMNQLRGGLETYVPLPHRLEFVGEVAGRKFYNDSLATTPESAVVGLESFSEPVILLAGGYDKQVDLSELARQAARRTKAVALMGQTASILRGLMARDPQAIAAVSGDLPDFPSSFRWAWDRSAPGDVILLSPGCASYDWFRNFADRGAQFTSLVRELAALQDGRSG